MKKVFMIGVSLLLIGGTAYSLKTQLKGGPLTETVFSRGEALYAQNCVTCHGVKGEGNGTASYLLFPKPRDFTKGQYRLISTNNLQASNTDLFNAITRGLPGSSMPSWSHLSNEDRWALVYFVRYMTELGGAVQSGALTEAQIQKGLSWTQKKKLASVDVTNDAIIQVPAEPASSKEGIERGKTIYAQACALCHGPTGKGDGPQKMVDSLGVAVKPRDLTAGVFKGSSASDDLWYRINAGLPGSPMPGFAGAYKDEQVWDLIHYVQTLPKKGAEQRARVSRKSLVAEKTEGSLAADPTAEIWQKIKPTFVSLTPLWWRDNRVEGVQVRAVHNGTQVAIHLSWVQAKADDVATAPQLFPDGAAIQFSTDPNPPFFAMGEKGKPILLWHWKATWQRDSVKRSDVETAYPNMGIDYYPSQKDYQPGFRYDLQNTSATMNDPQYLTGWGAGNPVSNPHRNAVAEEARAAGFGSLTSQFIDKEPVQANGVWKDGQWSVVFIRNLKVEEAERLQFEVGQKISVAFAVWDGAYKDRNGQKMVSIWNELVLAQ